MLRLITSVFGLGELKTPHTGNAYKVYQPEKPLNFVPRSDPSWSMLSRR